MRSRRDVTDGGKGEDVGEGGSGGLREGGRRERERRGEGRRERKIEKERGMEGGTEGWR